MAIYRTLRNSLPSTSLTDHCIVLDLDETLVHTFDGMNSLKNLDLLNNPNLLHIRKRAYTICSRNIGVCDSNTAELWGIRRPNLTEFLVFCFSYFKVVAVWSAGTKAYVESIVNIIFRDIRPPHVVFSRGDCEEIDSKTGARLNKANGEVVGESHNGIIIKPLSKMISSVPGLSKYMNLNNTFILDDRASTFLENPNNGILIPPYEPYPDIRSLETDDGVLLKLGNWFMNREVIASSDVTKLDKINIF